MRLSNIIALADYLTNSNPKKTPGSLASLSVLTRKLLQLSRPSLVYSGYGTSLAEPPQPTC